VVYFHIQKVKGVLFNSKTVKIAQEKFNWTSLSYECLHARRLFKQVISSFLELNNYNRPYKLTESDLSFFVKGIQG